MKLLDQVPSKSGCHTTVVPVILGDASTLTIPIRVIRGRKDGPILLTVAGEHGIELNGIAAIDNLTRELRPEEVTGTLMAIPALVPCNVQYRHHTFGQPRGQAYTYDMPWNTYAKWPGDRKGDPAERITSVLTEAVVKDADAVVNLHCWGWHSASCSFASSTHQGSLELAKAFGLTFLGYYEAYDQPLHPTHNPLVAFALAQDKPAMMAEMRTHHWIYPESVNRAKQGLRNVLVTLGMLDEPLALPEHQYELLGEEEIHAPCEGLFVPLKDIEQPVQAGEVLGYMLKVDTGERIEIASSCDGVTWLVNRVGPRPDVRLEDMHGYAEAGDLVAIVKKIRPLHTE